MAVTCGRYKFMTVSLLKRFRNGNGHFVSETALRQFQERSRHLDPEVLQKIRWDF
jgi:hypothetical protein